MSHAPPPIPVDVDTAIAPSDTLELALLAFHTEAGSLDLAKNRSGHNAEYLDLDKAMEQIRPLLAKHGLFPRHYTRLHEGVWVVASAVVHAGTGEEIDSGPFPLKPTKDDAQGWGGALTYGKRYTLLAALALVADNDDDGAGAKPKRAAARTAPGKITGKQRQELMDAVREAGVPTDRVAEIIREVAEVGNSTEIPAGKFADVLKAIKRAGFHNPAQ